jgi:hypothetical protein
MRSHTMYMYMKPGQARMQPRSAHMQRGSENEGGEPERVAIQGVQEAKPSMHAASVGGSAHMQLG